MRIEDYKITTSKELTKFIKRNTCTILKFSAKWCGPCKSEKFLNAYNDLKKKYSKNLTIKFIEFDVDQDEDIITNKKYYLWEITSVPAFKLYHKSKRLSNHSGTSIIPEIEKEIDQIISLKDEKNEDDKNEDENNSTSN
jgi:thiol-disulfide isomerase/thioredoxin